MPRRKTTRQAPKKSAAQVHKTPAANRCRALVRVDGTSIRNKIRKDYEKARRDLDQARLQLDQYQQKDLPAFTLWLNSHFGAMLTELRETSQKLAEDEGLVLEVEDELFFHGGPEGRAYRRVMEQRARREIQPPPGAGANERDREESPFGARPEFGEEDEDELIDEFMKEVFGDLGANEAEEEYGPRSRRHHQADAPPASARLKDLYRKVVRCLHPDRQQEMTAQKTEWWHQAQAAYEAGDVEQLEVILTLCDIGESGTTAHTSVSVLQRITTALKSSVRELKRQLSQYRHQPAWDFSHLTNREAVTERVRRDLTHDLQQMREQLQRLRDLIGRWKAAADRLKQPREKRRASSSNLEFGF